MLLFKKGLKPFKEFGAIDKWNQQLKLEIWDINKPFRIYFKFVSSNLASSNLFLVCHYN